MQQIYQYLVHFHASYAVIALSFRKEECVAKDAVFVGKKRNLAVVTAASDVEKRAIAVRIQVLSPAWIPFVPRGG